MQIGPESPWEQMVPGAQWVVAQVGSTEPQWKLHALAAQTKGAQAATCAIGHAPMLLQAACAVCRPIAQEAARQMI